MARILVTGAGGFVGCAIAAALARRGDTVVAADRQVSPALQALAVERPGVVVEAADVTEWPRMAALVQAQRPEAIVHCAAVVGPPASVAAPLATLRVNVEGTLALLELMRLHGIARMIHISSEEVYGPFRTSPAAEDHPTDPRLPYGISKLAAEQLGRTYAELYGLACINLRTCWVYGPDLPRPRVPKNLLDAALAGRPLHLPGGAETRIDHTYVTDLVDGVLAALNLPRHPYDTYNVASGTAPSVAEIVAVVKELVPGADLSVGPGDTLETGGVTLVRKGALDIARAREVLGYRPRYDIRAGLAASLEVLRGRAGT